MAISVVSRDNKSWLGDNHVISCSGTGRELSGKVSESALAAAAIGVVHAPKRNPDADDDNQYMPEHVRHSVRRSAEGNSSADEDSDFD